MEFETVGDVGSDSTLNINSTDNETASRGNKDSSLETVGDVGYDLMGFPANTPSVENIPSGGNSIVSPGDVQG